METTSGLRTIWRRFCRMPHTGRDGRSVGAGPVRSDIGHGASGDAVPKALEDLVRQVTALERAMADQDARLKSWAAAGRGRRAVLNVHDKPAPESLARAGGMTPDDLLAKALDAQKAGRLRGHDVVLLEAYLGRGQQPPADLVARVLG